MLAGQTANFPVFEHPDSGCQQLPLHHQVAVFVEQILSPSQQVCIGRILESSGRPGSGIRQECHLV